MNNPSTHKSKQPKVYLAGPDVFYKNAQEFAKAAKEFANEVGLEGLFPCDNLPTQKSEDLSRDIFESNLDLMRQADYVVANVNPWRGGQEPDSGTVWEMGFAFALGKKVFAYTGDLRDMIQRYEEVTGGKAKYDNGFHWDSEGRFIEGFGDPLNLMLQKSATKVVNGNVFAALREVSIFHASLKAQTQAEQ